MMTTKHLSAKLTMLCKQTTVQLNISTIKQSPHNQRGLSILFMPCCLFEIWPEKYLQGKPTNPTILKGSNGDWIKTAFNVRLQYKKICQYESFLPGN